MAPSRVFVPSFCTQFCSDNNCNSIGWKNKFISCVSVYCACAPYFLRKGFWQTSSFSSLAMSRSKIRASHLSWVTTDLAASIRGAASRIMTQPSGRRMRSTSKNMSRVEHLCLWVFSSDRKPSACTISYVLGHSPTKQTLRWPGGTVFNGDPTLTSCARYAGA